jgi:hypothetical protein
MNIEVPLEAVCDRLERLEERLAVREASASLTQEWYTLRQAARLKRGVEIRPSSKTGEPKTFESFYHTLRHRPELQPAGGIPDGEVGGVFVWHRDTVQRWLNQLDS